jgi:hypothetical protein
VNGKSAHTALPVYSCYCLLAVSVSTELNAACSVIVNLADQMDRTMLYWLQMFFLLVYERCVFCNTMFSQAVSSVVIIQEYEQDRVEKI